jgi:hypothetical protein
MRQAKRHVRDADLAKAGVALKRAAARARKLAEQTNTPLVIFEGGRVVRKKVTSAEASRTRARKVGLPRG